MVLEGLIDERKRSLPELYLLLDRALSDSVLECAHICWYIILHIFI